MNFDDAKLIDFQGSKSSKSMSGVTFERFSLDLRIEPNEGRLELGKPPGLQSQIYIYIYMYRVQGTSESKGIFISVSVLFLNASLR